jgi:hypothetical protein
MIYLGFLELLEVLGFLSLAGFEDCGELFSVLLELVLEFG